MRVCHTQTGEYFPHYALVGRRAQRFSMDEDADGRFRKHVRQRSVCNKWEHGGGKDLKPGDHFHLLVVFRHWEVNNVLDVME